MNIIFDGNEQLSAHLMGQMHEILKYAFTYEGIDGSDIEVSLTLVSKEEIQELNRTYRGNDMPTDVLSFPQFEPDEPLEGAGEIFIGDVVICTEKAREQADDLGHSFERELLYLFTHSIFHLLGYDHMEMEEKQEMRQGEEFVMEKIGVAR